MTTRVLLNGKIVTADEQFSVHQAVAIDGDRITSVGPDAAVRAHAGPAAQVTDLGGRTVIPGLIDNHNHFVRATEHAEVRLEGVRSRTAALGLLGRRAAELEPGQWLLTLGGWHEDQWEGDRRGIALAELDAIAGGRPAYIQAQYDHAFVNTAWLDAMDVPSGDVTRETGRVGGGLVALNRAAAGFPAGHARDAGVRTAMAWYNSLGLTAVFDPGGVGVSEAAYATVRDMAARGELTLRVFTTLRDNSKREVTGDHSKWKGTGDNSKWKGTSDHSKWEGTGDHSKWEGTGDHSKWKGTGDNSKREREGTVFADTIRARRPFQGDVWHDQIAVGEIYHSRFHWDHTASPPRPSGADIEAATGILRAAAETGWPVQTHSVTTEGLALVLDAYERVSELRPIRPLRWSLTHAEGITAGQLERARRLGVTIQLRSQGVVGNHGRAVAAYGQRAARAMPPLRLVQDSGLTWGLGTDGTRAAQVNPFITLWWAVTGRSLGGDRVLDEPITREQALIAHTRSNAALMFAENYLGSIRPGLLADLVVLDRDYLTVPEDEIRDITPAATMVGGEVVYGALPSRPGGDMR